MSQKFFDPAWVHAGEFDLSEDDRKATRTMQVRDELARLERRSFKLKPNPRHGHPVTYYLREGERGELEAQYYMSLDRACRTLSLGVSLEKGHEHAGAEPHLRMDRKSWDWPRLVALGQDRIVALLTAIAHELDRPVAIVVESHRPDEEEANGERRDTVPFVLVAERFFVRATPVSPERVFRYLREIDTRKEWWADVWFVAEFTEEVVGTLKPDDVAERLFAFRSIRDALRKR